MESIQATDLCSFSFCTLEVYVMNIPVLVLLCEILLKIIKASKICSERPFWSIRSYDLFALSFQLSSGIGIARATLAFGASF